MLFSQITYDEDWKPRWEIFRLDEACHRRLRLLRIGTVLNVNALPVCQPVCAVRTDVIEKIVCDNSS